MKASRLSRDRQTDLVLRAILQAFDNASAVESNDQNRATYGLGGDVERKTLDDEDLQVVLAALIEERIESARVLETHGQQIEADALHAEVDIMRRYLG